MTPEELDERYYVRVRGKVQGPWTLRRLRSLRSRGQLSRAFDVSTDRVNWTPATQIPGLSDPETRAGGITIDPDEVPLDVVPMEESASTPPQTSVEIPDVGAAIRAASLTTFLLIVLVGAHCWFLRCCCATRNPVKLVGPGVNRLSGTRRLLPPS